MSEPIDLAVAGASLDQALAAVVLLHGRGSSGHQILRLAELWPLKGVAFVAPSSESGTWYPHRFLAPIEANEPWLSESLGLVERIMVDLESKGLSADKVGLVGFSQGACLALEHVYRKPRKYGFVAGLSGALIGPVETSRGPFRLSDVPVMIGCAEEDAHIPIDHAKHSAVLFRASGALVSEFWFPGEAHQIFPDEINWISARLREVRGE